MPKGLKVLEEYHGKSKEVQEKPYQNFVDSFGTHYQQSSIIGSKFMIEEIFKKDWQGQDEKQKYHFQCLLRNLKMDYIKGKDYTNTDKMLNIS